MKKRKEKGPCSNEQGPNCLLYFFFFSERERGKRKVPRGEKEEVASEYRDLVGVL